MWRCLASGSHSDVKCKHSCCALSHPGIQRTCPLIFWCLQTWACRIPEEKADCSLALSIFIFSWNHCAFLGHHSTWPTYRSISTMAPVVPDPTGCWRLKPMVPHLLCCRWGVCEALRIIGHATLYAVWSESMQVPLPQLDQGSEYLPVSHVSCTHSPSSSSVSIGWPPQFTCQTTESGLG